jgi:TPP-dependent pyruvate/acetoin dehydrogenase alpha subunit
MLTKQELVEFEKEIAELYNKGEIKAPVHLVDNNEEQLIEIFKDNYKDGDIILSTWRSHLHWLLSGRSKEELKKQILEGYSMSVFDKNFITSSIVAGIAPIAVGIAMGLKLKNSKNKVLCFLGDASFECGITKESIRYSEGHNLPILFIIENNARCVRAKTKEVWGIEKTKKVIEYHYKPNFPHAGCGEYKQF